MNQDQLRDQIAESLNSAYRPNPPGCEDLDETSRHDGHQFSGGCYVCRGDVPKLVDAVSGVVAPLLAEREAERDNAVMVGDRLGWRLVEAEEQLKVLKWLHAEVAHEVERLHSWDGLMELLDEHWPADIFLDRETAAERSADDGPRVIALIRALDAVRAERAALWELLKQQVRTRRSVERGLVELHERTKAREEGEECSGRDDTGQASREDIAAKTLGRGLTTSGEPGPGDVTATSAPLSSRPQCSVHPEGGEQ